MITIGQPSNSISSSIRIWLLFSPLHCSLERRFCDHFGGRFVFPTFWREDEICVQPVNWPICVLRILHFNKRNDIAPFCGSPGRNAWHPCRFPNSDNLRGGVTIALSEPTIKGFSTWSTEHCTPTKSKEWFLRPKSNEGRDQYRSWFRWTTSTHSKSFFELDAHNGSVVRKIGATWNRKSLAMAVGKLSSPVTFLSPRD